VYDDTIVPLGAMKHGLVAGLLLGVAAWQQAFAAGAVDPQVTAVAREARRAVSIIDSFYADHRACPQPSRPAELKELQAALGDGFSAEAEGQFVTITGISMTSGNWRYYSSARYPDRCSLWRPLTGGSQLIWRRNRSAGAWAFSPGDGTPEKPFKLPASSRE
jgi:hypothetical protein